MLDARPHHHILDAGRHRATDREEQAAPERDVQIVQDLGAEQRVRQVAAARKADRKEGGARVGMVRSLYSGGDTAKHGGENQTQKKSESAGAKGRCGGNLLVRDFVDAGGWVAGQPAGKQLVGHRAGRLVADLHAVHRHAGRALDVIVLRKGWDSLVCGAAPGTIVIDRAATEVSIYKPAPIRKQRDLINDCLLQSEFPPLHMFSSFWDTTILPQFLQIL